MRDPPRDPGAAPAAVIVGASSGIGAALALRLMQDGWRLGLAARRADRLAELAVRIGPSAHTATLDLARPEEAREHLRSLLDTLGGADLIVVTAGTGELNRGLAWAPDRATLDVNVTGFAAVAQLAMEHFLARGSGHLVGVSSVAKLRGSGDAAAYAASKAFVSTYLDGLRDRVRPLRGAIAVTEVCPGFVQTAMMKAEHPFWIASPERAADAIAHAIRRRAKRAYITRRWGLVGALLRLLPAPG